MFKMMRHSLLMLAVLLTALAGRSNAAQSLHDPASRNGAEHVTSYFLSHGEADLVAGQHHAGHVQHVVLKKFPFHSSFSFAIGAPVVNLGLSSASGPNTARVPQHLQLIYPFHYFW